MVQCADCQRIRVVIAHEWPMMREGLQVSLGRGDEIAVVGIAADSLELRRLVERYQPEVVVLGEHLSGLSIASLACQICGYSPHVNLLVIGNKETSRSQRLIRLRVRGFLNYTATGSEITSAVRLVAKGKAIINADTALGCQQTEYLTTIELQILRLLMTGKHNAEIAKELDRSEKTVEYHMTHILSKLGARSRVEAIIRAHDLELHAD